MAKKTFKHLFPGLCALGLLLMLAVRVLADAPPSTSSADPLLELLIKKGLVTKEEAEKVRTEAFASQSNSVAFASSKWSFGKTIKKGDIFGDIRMRYENRQTHSPNGNRVEMDRFRYALRLGMRGELQDDYYFGLRLETGANPRSPWLTFASSAAGTPYQGPFGRSTATIGLGQIYLGWKPQDWVELTVGKMPNPLYTTSMIWDPDINPEGAAEHFNYTVGQADFFANFGQFIYQDVNPVRTAQFVIPTIPFGQSEDDPFLFAWQGGVKYHINTNVSFKVAASVYHYLHHGANTAPGSFPLTPGFSDSFVGEGAGVPVVGSSGFPTGPNNGFAFNQTGINSLFILDIPFELDFKLGKYNARMFGDFAENLEGAARAQAAVAGALTNNPTITLALPLQKYDNKAYQFGASLDNFQEISPNNGFVPKKGNWEAKAYWQHVEQYALDPNLLDSDFFEGRGNLQGVYLSFSYSFADSLMGAIRAGEAWRINHRLGTGGANQDIPFVNPIKQYQLVQMDLVYKF